MSELDPALREKFPNLEVMIGCGADIWCGKTNDRCIQMVKGCITSHSIDSGYQVDSLPEAPKAGGCSGCENNKLK